MEHPPGFYKKMTKQLGDKKPSSVQELVRLLAGAAPIRFFSMTDLPNQRQRIFFYKKNGKNHFRLATHFFSLSPFADFEPIYGRMKGEKTETDSAKNHNGLLGIKIKMSQPPIRNQIFFSTFFLFYFFFLVLLKIFTVH